MDQKARKSSESFSFMHESLSIRPYFLGLGKGLHFAKNKARYLRLSRVRKISLNLRGRLSCYVKINPSSSSFIQQYRRLYLIINDYSINTPAQISIHLRPWYGLWRRLFIYAPVNSLTFKVHSTQTPAWRVARSIFKTHKMSGKLHVFNSLYGLKTVSLTRLYVVGDNPFSKHLKTVEVDGENLRFFDLTSLEDKRYGMYICRNRQVMRRCIVHDCCCLARFSFRIKTFPVEFLKFSLVFVRGDHMWMNGLFITVNSPGGEI